MNEVDILRKVLRGEVAIIYGENIIQVVNRENRKQSKTVRVPKEILPKVKDFILHPGPRSPNEWIPIRDHLFEVALAIMEIELLASSPKERELKVASFIQLFKKFLKEMQEIE